MASVEDDWDSYNVYDIIVCMLATPELSDAMIGDFLEMKGSYDDCKVAKTTRRRDMVQIELE